ncbi:MAG: polyphosphate kinase 1 [Phycisphaerae bacterium]|nr:polyphosphate kinase 1 [Phycisphaerae bacterium]
MSVEEPRNDLEAIASDQDFQVALQDPSRFLNRDLQWLRFNQRVLDLACDDRTPLLERVRFLAIYSNNLDEFFMKRVGGLRRQIDAGLGSIPNENISPSDQISRIRKRVEEMNRIQTACYKDQILPKLAAKGVELIRWKDMTPQEQEEAEHWYRRNVFPILTPLSVDPGHRFPFISNMSVSLGVMLRRPGESEQLFARVKVPELQERLYRVPDKLRFVLLQDIIEHNLDDLFPGMEILKVLPFRVTRNADVERDHEDAEDLLEQIQQQLRERRFAQVVRVEIGRKPNKKILRFLTEELDLNADDFYETTALLDNSVLNQIADLDIPGCHYRKWTPIAPRGLQTEESDIFSLIRSRDILVHHPYESFDASVEHFIENAAKDPKVLCIKQALYRTSGDSPFIPNLIRAAEAGKQVAVLVELRARFDEARNIHWARKLEDAGVHVAYGVVGLKTHTKTALVVRQEADGIRSYVHIGTGNYNSVTARLYEDLGLFTCDSDITEDIVDLFNYMTGRSRQRDYRKLLVAPVAMKRRFIEMIEREILLQTPERPGHIIAKMNQIEDRAVTDALYRASQAGVKVDLIVRGFCCLRPQVTNLSENIRVMSILGRFLEHSRIFWFSLGKEDPIDGEFYIGSADWMYRNLNRRVEAIVPIESKQLRKRLHAMLQVMLEDQLQVWEMHPDGSYTLRNVADMDPEDPQLVGTHETLMRLAESELHYDPLAEDE